MPIPLRVLILEDSIDDAELLVEELSQAGFELDWRQVETQSDYLAQLHEGLDVILADYALPQFSALHALQLLQESGLDISLIIITGSIGEEMAVECMKRGAADYLLKGRLMRLGQAVKQAVQAKQLRDQKRQAEVALQESEARFRRIVNNAQDIIYRYRVNAPRGFEYVSPAVTAITGYTVESHYADPELWLKVVHDSDRATLQRWMVGEGLSQPVVLQWFHQDERRIWTEHRAVPIHNEAGDLIAIEGIARDITQQKQAEIQLRLQARRDRLLRSIALQIRQSLNLTEILNTTVAEVQQYLEADRVLLYQFDTEWNGVLVAASVNPDWEIDSDIELHRTWWQEAQPFYEQGQIQAVDDIHHSGLSLASIDWLVRLRVQAKLVVPIPLDNLLWGVLVVHQCSQVRQWQPTEIDLLEKLATQVSIAIQQAQLFDQLQQQAQREQLLNQISQSLNSSLDPEHILQAIVRLVGESFEVERATIYSIEPDRIRVLNEWRANEQIVSVLNWQSSSEEYADLLDPACKFSLHHVYHTPSYADLPLTPERRARVEKAQILSVLRVPIFIRDQLFGGLSLQTVTTRRIFTDEETQLLERVADHAAIALYNAQSYERLEQLVKDRTQALEEEKLISEAANRAKSDFLANMSHELRTPMTSVLGFSRLLLEQHFGALNDKQQQYLTLIVESGEHLITLINDLLDLAKIEAGREDLSLDTIEIKQVCQECLSLVHERAVSKGLKLSLVIDTDLTTCSTDRRRLKQILVNLLSNAVKFTEAGSVILSVNQTETEIQFSVIDTGIGIAEADQAKLFQPFQQLDSSLSRRYEGTGLGLALSRKLARLCGGNVTLQSGFKKGSCFTLSLPLLQD